MRFNSMGYHVAENRDDVAALKIYEKNRKLEIKNYSLGKENNELNKKLNKEIENKKEIFQEMVKYTDKYAELKRIDYFSKEEIRFLNDKNNRLTKENLEIKDNKLVLNKKLKDLSNKLNKFNEKIIELKEEFKGRQVEVEDKMVEHYTHYRNKITPLEKEQARLVKINHILNDLLKMRVFFNEKTLIV